MSSAILQAGVNAVTGPLNNLMAAKRERTARKENYEYNEKAANNADARTRALYKDLYSPQAQMQQVQEAGLSPSIFASGGMAGKSGVSGAQGAGASGISPQTYGISPIDVAQIELTKAQTEKVKAEKDTIEGDNARGQAEIQAIIAGIENTEQKTKLEKALTDYNQSLTRISTATEIWQIDRAESEATTAFYMSYKTQSEAEIAKLQKDYTAETYSTRVMQLTADLKNTLKDTLLKQAQIELNDTQAEQLIKQVAIAQYDSITKRASVNNTHEYMLEQAQNFLRTANLTNKNIETNRELGYLKAFVSMIGFMGNSATY